MKTVGAGGPDPSGLTKPDEGAPGSSSAASEGPGRKVSSFFPIHSRASEAVNLMAQPK